VAPGGVSKGKLKAFDLTVPWPRAKPKGEDG
jgi:hypothetical protein